MSARNSVGSGRPLPSIMRTARSLHSSGKHDSSLIYSRIISDAICSETEKVSIPDL